MTEPQVESHGAAVYSSLRLEEVRYGFALGESVFGRQGSPLYSALCHEAQHDDDILDLAAHASPGQPPAFHLLSTVHYLTLGSAQHDLVHAFNNASAHAKPGPEVYGVFRNFCMSYAAPIRRVLKTTSVQSTAVSRAGFVLPSLDYLHQQVGAPLHLIEVGCSAGLLLLFDQYRYDFGPWGSIGDEAAIATVSVDLVGDYPRQPRAIPPVATRVGIDLNPIDPSNNDARRWLRALLFPEWRRQGEVLEQALNLAANAGHTVLGGDANVLLPDLLEGTPDPVCVFHSMCLYYFPKDAQVRFDNILREASTGRSIHRLSVEMAPSYASQAHAAAAGGASDSIREMPAEVTHAVYHDGKSQSEVLAHTDRYGAWFEWLTPPR